MRRLRASMLALTGIVSFAVAFAATRAGKIPTYQSLRGSVGLMEPSYTPRHTAQTGNQLVMVYFGSSNCARSNGKQLQKDVENIKLGLEEKAVRDGWSFMAVGVAVEWSVPDGIDYLRKFGEFDQVSAGYSWANSLAMKYFWTDIPGIAATPQILVLSRSLTVPERGEIGSFYSVEGERIAARKVGTEEMRQWIENGLPLADLDSVSPDESRETAY